MGSSVSKRGMSPFVEIEANDPGCSLQSVRLQKIYDRCKPELCRYISKTFGAGPPEPEDVVQAAFAHFAALDNPDRIENPRAFLYRVAHNIVVSQYRRQAVHRKYVHETRHVVQENILDDLHPERVLLAKEKTAILKDALETLPELERKLVIMHRIHGLSYAEIARRMKMSQTEVKRQIARAIVTCHDAIERKLAK